MGVFRLLGEDLHGSGGALGGVSLANRRLGPSQTGPRALRLECRGCGQVGAGGGALLSVPTPMKRIPVPEKREDANEHRESGQDVLTKAWSMRHRRASCFFSQVNTRTATAATAAVVASAATAFLTSGDFSA